MVKASQKERRRLELLFRALSPLYYRQSALDQSGVRALKELLREFPRHWTGKAAAYALGRIYLDQVSKTSPSWKVRLRKIGMGYLESVKNTTALNTTRVRKAGRIINAYKLS